MSFKFNKTELNDSYLIEDFSVSDNRGEFVKTFEKDIFSEIGINFYVNESFYSRSFKNVIRGLHFQTKNPQSKIVSVISGRVWDVIVDLRQDSDTFRKWYARELSADNHLSLYIPSGFAHGFASLEDNTVMLYLCEGKYDKHSDSGIIFNDPDICIDWPIDKKKSIHSDRDLGFRTFKELFGKKKEQVCI